MGCWNNTCAISKLPIMDGDSVVALFLVDTANHEKDRLSSPYTYHAPLPFYVKGHYNDYGAVDNEYGVMLEPIVNLFSKHIKEFELGSNEYHDIAVSRGDDLDWSKIMNADHEDRLFLEIPSMFGRDTNDRHVTHVEVRQEVWDNILELYSIERYYRDSDGNFTKSNNGYADVVDEYPKFFEQLKAECSTTVFRSLFSDINMLIPGLLKSNYKKNMTAMEVEEYLRSQIDKNENITAEELWPVVENALQVAIVSDWLSSNGGQWMIPGHIGQESDTENQTDYANIILRSAEVINNRWDDEE